MIRLPPRSTPKPSSEASDVYKIQTPLAEGLPTLHMRRELTDIPASPPRPKVGRMGPVRPSSSPARGPKADPRQPAHKALHLGYPLSNCVSPHKRECMQRLMIDLQIHIGSSSGTVHGAVGGYCGTLICSSSPAVPRQSTKRIRCATNPLAIVHPYMQALPRRSPAKVLSGLGEHHIPRFHDLIHEYGARALRTSLAKAMHAWPWLEEVAAQRDTTGGVDAQTYCVCQSVTPCHCHLMLLSLRKCRVPKKMHASYMPQ